MNNLNRNTRTLIVCFVVALMIMVPLRFAEEGQNYVAGENEVNVLGESEIVEDRVVEEPQEMGLEAPYDEIEALGQTEQSEVLGESVAAEEEAVVAEEAPACTSREEADANIKALTEFLSTENLSEEQSSGVIQEIGAIEASVCQ